jgi:FAD/FMN-containing dehydrogenase/Fe-S oxidoreductase
MGVGIPLQVLDSSDRIARGGASTLEADLSKIVRGQVRFGRHDRMLYSTDASPYQVEPLGVVVPNDADDVAAVMTLCAQRRISVLPRGGGTSLAGQCTNRAVVIDLSALCRRVISVSPQERICEVEAGIGLDELNRHLATSAPGLFYAPDPATVAQATIGGCVGNNAAGARSIKYGRTSENVAGVDVLLSTGERVWLQPRAGRYSAVARQLATKAMEVVARNADHIRARFVKTIRHNAGYSLDLILNQLDAGTTPEDIDLSGLICGSEGTLAFVVAAKLKLHPIRNAVGLAVASFATLEAAMDAVNPILASGPSAVELLDDVVLRAALGNPGCKPYVDLLPRAGGDAPPAAVLYVEYQGDIEAEIDAGFEKLATTLPGVPIVIYRDKPAMAEAWMLRKSGEPLLHGLPGRRKPQTFVEDNAVPVEQLPRFVREFKRIVARHGTEAAYWAHASVGVLHVRPMLDLHDEEDLAHMRQIAVEVADLARECGGILSGEHGDGRVRGPLLERYYGPEITGAFLEIKRLFDPAGILNPGNIVGPGPIESITENLRAHGAGGNTQQPKDQKAAGTPTRTYFDYADQDDFGHAVDRCNGAGFCRKTAGGTMCPSYRATLDERHSTRGRGNALREAIRGALGNGQPVWNDAETLATLDLCLSCKACKSECPSNVDVARLKAEYLAQSWDSRGGPPLKAFAFGHVRSLNKMGSITPRLANFVANLRPLRAVMNRVLGIAPQRSLPAFAPSLHRWFERSHRPTPEARPSKPIVVLYADCFTTYNEPHIGRAAVQLLEALGYEVRLPRVACCGRAMISNGLLPDAIATADRALKDLALAVDDESVVGVLVCEPSCLSAITDDWLQLKLTTPLDRRKRLAAKSMMVEDFLEKFWDVHPRKPIVGHDAPSVLLHGHCHQKALGKDEAGARLLRRLTSDKVTVLQSGCCGMAGSFGYAADKFEISMAIGELSVFPPIRSSDPATIICASGTSCRHQIHDGTGRNAIHPIELAASMIQLN